MDEMDSMFGTDEGNEQVHERPANSGVLAFHEGTEEALYVYVKSKVSQGDTDGVLRAIDEFCYTRHWMMHIGDKKLAFLNNAIDTFKVLHRNEAKRTLVELGAYCGYSAISIARKLESGRDMLYSVEKNAQCCAWTERMVNYAGVQDRVTVLNYKGSEAKDWKPCLHTDSIHLLFIDHDKKQYLPDLKIIESVGLLKTDAVVVADNVVVFGLNEYFDYVRDPQGHYKSSELFEDTIEYANSESERQQKDGIEVSIHK